MPRAKRALAEADANAPAQEPAPKKASTGSKATQNASEPASGKENTEYSSQTIVQLQHLLVDRDLPAFGRKTKATLIGFLEENDKLLAEARKNPGSKKPADSTKATKGKAGSDKAVTTKKTNPKSNGAKLAAAEPEVDLFNPSAWKFVTQCRPGDDIANERELEGHVEANDGSGPHFECGTDKCKCRKSMAKFPDWKWVITRKGFNMMLKLQKEVEHRDQDEMDQYQYNDFSGYGVQEVVDNHLLSFHKAVEKGADPVALWSHIEGLANISLGDGPWFRCDDPDTILYTLQTWGYAVMTTLQVFEDHGLLKPDGPVKDISLIAGLMAELGATWPGDIEEQELSWIQDMILLLESHGITLAGAPYGVEKTVEKFEEVVYETEDDEEPGDNDYSLDFWKAHFRKFTGDRIGYDAMLFGGTIGGRHYDLTSKKTEWVFTSRK